MEETRIYDILEQKEERRGYKNKKVTNTKWVEYPLSLLYKLEESSYVITDQKPYFDYINWFTEIDFDIVIIYSSIDFLSNSNNRSEGCSSSL